MLLAEDNRIIRFQGLTADEEYTSEIVRDANSFIYKSMSASDNVGVGSYGMQDEAQIAVNIILQNQSATTSFLQRKLGWSFNKAASVMDTLEKSGIVGPYCKGKREILAKSIEDAEALINNYRSELSKS